MSKADDPSNLPDKIYTIETVERITHISRNEIVLYHQYGLVPSLKETPEQRDLLFDDEAIHRLRRIAFLISEYGINQRGLKVIAELMDEVEKLRARVRFLQKN